MEDLLLEKPQKEWKKINKSPQIHYYDLTER